MRERYNMMLDAVRRWLGWGQSLPAWDELSAWARAGRWTLKRTLGHEGWVMDGDAHPGWRVEWGPAQRRFMGTHELRVRVEVPGMPETMQALVLDRPLLARLDQAVYEQFTDNVQTRLDDETPEEMRWLAMHAKLSPNQVGPRARDRYGALCNDPDWMAAWLAGPLGEALGRRAEVLSFDRAPSHPFVLRLARGQLVLRQGVDEPVVGLLQSCVDVAAAAAGSLPPG